MRSLLRMIVIVPLVPPNLLQNDRLPLVIFYLLQLKIILDSYQGTLLLTII